MSKCGIHTNQAEADTDRLIASTAILASETSAPPVIVIGTDTEVLVMLVTQALPYTNVYMLCQTNPPMSYNCNDIQHAIGDTAKQLLFLQAVTGCDTVSAIYRQSKHSILLTKTNTMNN